MYLVIVVFEKWYCGYWRWNYPLISHTGMDRPHHCFSELLRLFSLVVLMWLFHGLNKTEQQTVYMIPGSWNLLERCLTFILMDGDSHVIFIQVFVFSANLVFGNSIFQQGHPASSKAFKRSKGSSGPLGFVLYYELLPWFVRLYRFANAPVTSLAHLPGV